MTKVAKPAFVLAVCVPFLAACSIEPWVKPYEREALADPIMDFSRDPSSDAFRRHAFEVTEAAQGATVGRGGGCGCN